MELNIKQIVVRQYTDKNGGIGSAITGLGDDNQVYEWSRGMGKWILSVISN